MNNEENNDKKQFKIKFKKKKNMRDGRQLNLIP